MSKKKVVLIVLVLAFVIVDIITYFVPELDIFGAVNPSDEGDIQVPVNDGDSYTQMPTIIYHVADFSENIYDDEEYLELVGPYAMFYKNANVEFSVTEEDIYSCGEFAEFIYEYIQCVKEGNHEKYNSLFFAEYFKNHDKMKEFTQQKIYDLRVEELNTVVNLDEKEYSWVKSQGLEPHAFVVKYKIRHNNGSFRLGMNSDVYQPQLFILAYDRLDNVKIIDIVSYTER